MGKLEFDQEIGLHNKFHIVVTDVRSGEVTREAWAFNLLLDQGIKKIFDGFSTYEATSYYTSRYCMMLPQDVDYGASPAKRFGGYVHIGTGSGTLSASRIELFDFYKGFYGSYYDSGWDSEYLTGFFTLMVFLPLGEPFPGPITEIGLASYHTPAYLSTHALLQDSEGKPISLNPGPFEQIKIYATNYISLSHSYGGNIGFAGANNNFFKKVFTDNIEVVSKNANRYIVSLGKNSKTVSSSDPAIITSIATKGLNNNAENVIMDKTMKTITFNNVRFIGEAGNDNQGIREIGFTWHDFPVFRSVLPIPGVWTGKDIEDEEVDTGDGQTKVFNLKWPDIVYESEEIYVQGRSPELQARGTDYTMSDPETSEITFAVPPASGAAITANYAVDYIPKDENHVLDISFTFSFKDANAE